MGRWIKWKGKEYYEISEQGYEKSWLFTPAELQRARTRRKDFSRRKVML